MKSSKSSLMVALLLSLSGLAACSGASTKSPIVTGQIRQSLDQFGYKDVSVSQDRIKAVVVLTGRVSADADREQAESIARSIAPGQIVSNEIMIMPPPSQSAAKVASLDVDKGIARNVNTALIENRVKKNVKYRVKGGVVTLKGNVSSQLTRAQVEQIAYAVPNVLQVVNELQVEN